MNNIYIVEDNINFSVMLKNLFENYTTSHDKTVFDDIVVVNDAFIDFLSSVKEKTGFKHLYVLDIDLKDGITGFQLAKEIRTFDPNGYILFITSHIELMGQVFLHNLKAISFIYKSDPLLNERISSVMDQIYLETCLQENDSVVEAQLMYQYKSNYYKINYTDISLIETDPIKRRLQIYTDKDVYPCQIKLKDLYEDLPDYFIRLHRSIVVNVNAIKNISMNEGLYTAVLKSNKLLPISRSYVEEVIRAFHDQSFV